MTSPTAVVIRSLSESWPPPGPAPVGDGRARRLLPPGADKAAEDLVRHLARHGPAPRLRDGPSRDALLAKIEQAGLLGRGGASFPSAKKLRAVNAQQRRAVVVANGTEGEPASAKDKVLLARAPHLVLDGAVLAAELVGARHAIVVVHRAVRDVVDHAVGERRRAGLDAVHLTIVTAVDRFVAGEASAVVNFLDRGVALPRMTPPRLAERGLGGRPTLVQNVETLAHLALIARHGARWYRAIGTEAEPGSTLVTLLGPLRYPGVYEVALGTPVSDVLAMAGGASGPLQALLFGGYFGSWATAASALEAPFSTAGLSALGATVGAGLIVALPANKCGLVETARVVRYLAGQSAGQCGPCVFGLPAIAGELEALAAGGEFNLAQLSRWLDQVDGRGACSHPDGVARLVRSAVLVFADEVNRHRTGWCCATGGTGPVLPIGSGGLR
jgi:NADH:ubiquinone oxidoreductase subunit F (NADH-binding)